MKYLALALGCLLLAPAASAQVTDIPPELVTYFDDVEAEMGVTRLGTPVMGWLEEEDLVVVSIGVSSNEDTYLQIVCDDFCEEIWASAATSDGRIIDHGAEGTPEPVLLIPAGSGAQVSVTLTMGYCDEWECQFAVQAFVQ